MLCILVYHTFDLVWCGVFFFVCEDFVSFIIVYFALCLDMQISISPSIYFGFADGAIRHTRNLVSTTWVVYSLNDELVSSGGFCLGPTINNVAEYHVVIVFN